MAYILYNTHYNENDPNYELGDDIKVIRHQIRYYHSAMNNNALFEHPVGIHDRKKIE